MSEWQSVDPRQFVLTRSGFLSDPGFDWVSIGETRHLPHSRESMSGSVALSDAIIDQGIRLQFGEVPDDEKLAKRIEQRFLAGNRIETLQKMMGLKALATLRAVHETNFIDADAHMHELHFSRGTARPTADAAVTRTIGHGLLINPADCPVATLVHAPHDSEQRAVAQVHAGIQGLARNVIGIAFAHLKDEYGFTAANTFAYIQPHASSGFMIHGKALTDVEANADSADFLGKPEADGNREFDMTGMVSAQLAAQGVAGDHLLIDHTNSMTSEVLYSHRAASRKGFAGRNALAVGMRANFD